MTKKNLERRYKFLLLQLKKIHELEEKWLDADSKQRAEMMGQIRYISDHESLIERMEDIEDFNAEYNFFNKEMTIDNEEG